MRGDNKTFEEKRLERAMWSRKVLSFYRAFFWTLAAIAGAAMLGLVGGLETDQIKTIPGFIIGEVIAFSVMFVGINVGNRADILHHAYDKRISQLLSRQYSSHDEY